MSTFPVYEGYLPRCLNPLNPYHWLLLLYWIYFRPTALKCYLYQADSEVYQSEGNVIRNFVQVMKLPAYRNVWLTVILLPFAFLLFAFFIRVPFTSSSTLLEIIQVVLFIQCLGVFLNGGFLVVDVAFNVASVAAFGTAFSTAFIIACCGAAYLASYSDRALSKVAIGTAIGTAIVTAFGAAFGAATIVVFYVVGLAKKDLSVGFCIGLAAGLLRVPFYLVQLLSLSISKLRQRYHAIAWDEFGILPLPFTSSYLLGQLRHQEIKGLQRLSQIIGNPFQRWAVQRSAWYYLHQSHHPIESIYRWLQTTALDTYAIAPAFADQWRNVVSTRQLLLAELSGQPISRHGNLGLNIAGFVYQLTRPLRKNRDTSLTRLLRLFYELLYFDIYNDSYRSYNLFEYGEQEEHQEYNYKFRLNTYDSIYSAIQDCPQGIEIAESFKSMAQFLEFDEVEQLVDAQQSLTWIIPGENYLRHEVIQALKNLGDVSQEIQSYTLASSRVNKLAALARANDNLQNLADNLQNLDRSVRTSVSVNLPEHKILLCIIKQWRDLITTAGGSTGRETIVQPVANPYVFGSPVTGKLFVGRDDIFKRLKELWMQPGQIPSVIIYGHRRMGKTSILRNLPGHFGANTQIVDFNMQRGGLVQSPNELLYNLALAIYDELPLDLKSALFEPIEDTYLHKNPYTTFDRFLKEITSLRQQHRFIITVDEFELIEHSIKEGKLKPELLGYWRSLIQTYSWFVLAFAGLHTLQEMTEEYWNPLYGSVTRVPVSFLSRADAIELIANPIEDFSLDYDADAINAIYTLTGGQPYLIQLICHSLVSRFNRRRFEERREIEPRFTLVDIEIVIDSSDFYRDGNAYFRGIWGQAKEDHGTTQTTILQLLSHRSLTSVELSEQIQCDDFDVALQLLQNHGVIAEGENGYRYQVELMRRWVQQFSNKGVE